jgi:hypothetical protein
MKSSVTVMITVSAAEAWFTGPANNGQLNIHAVDSGHSVARSLPAVAEGGRAAKIGYKFAKQDRVTRQAASQPVCSLSAVQASRVEVRVVMSWRAVPRFM